MGKQAQMMATFSSMMVQRVEVISSGQVSLVGWFAGRKERGKAHKSYQDWLSRN